MKKVYINALLMLNLLLAIPSLALAGTTVTEGVEAEDAYAKEKDKVLVLVQKNKEFVLRTPDGKEKIKPDVVKVKAGERFYIINEEHDFVHNVYDETDANWVLKKQVPSAVASITFDAPGQHSLRCAIHPTMKIVVDVVK